MEAFSIMIHKLVDPETSTNRGITYEMFQLAFASSRVHTAITAELQKPSIPVVPLYLDGVTAVLGRFAATLCTMLPRKGC
jgi:hypothetical protein